MGVCKGRMNHLLKGIAPSSGLSTLPPTKGGLEVVMKGGVIGGWTVEAVKKGGLIPHLS